MGFYTGSKGFDESYITSNANVMDLLEDASVDILPESSSYYQCALEATAIDEANWNGIMKACGLQEYAHFLETGEEFVYTLEAGGGFIESVRAFLKKVWEKIKAIFRKFLVFLGAATSKGKEFVNKYRKDINSAISNIPDNAKYSGYKFTLDYFNGAVLANAGQIKTKAESIFTKTSGGTDYSSTTVNTFSADIGGANVNSSDSWDYEDEMEKVRGFLAGGSAMSASEFSKEVFEKLRNGESNKEDFDLNGRVVVEAMAHLDGYKDEERSVKKSYDTINKYFEGLDKGLSKAQTAMAKEKGANPTAQTKADNLVIIQRTISIVKGVTSSIQTANGLYLTAMKDSVNQAKSICVKAVSFKSKNEGYSFDNYDGAGGFMEAAIANMR